MPHSPEPTDSDNGSIYILIESAYVPGESYIVDSRIENRVAIQYGYFTDKEDAQALVSDLNQTAVCHVNALLEQSYDIEMEAYEKLLFEDNLIRDAGRSPVHPLPKKPIRVSYDSIEQIPEDVLFDLKSISTFSLQKLSRGQV